MKRIKVIILIATYRIGGPGKEILDICEVAPEFGFDPILVGFTVGREKNTPFLDEANRRKIKTFSIRHYFRYDPSPIIQFHSLLKRSQIDIIQTHGHKANFIAFALRDFVNRPWIAFVHGWTDEDWKIRVYNRLDKYLLRFADRLIAVSKDMASKLQTLGIPHEKVVTIYNAVFEKGISSGDPNLDIRREFKITQGDKLIGVIGRLSPEKGQIYFLKSFSEVTKTFPRVTALIVGEGPDEKKLKDFCALKQLDHKVIFTGYQKDIASIYKSLDLVVLPSLSEGMPNVALESMLLGKPVIGTNAGGTPEVIADEMTGLLVPPEDPPSLARAMLELLNDEKKMKIFSEKGRDWVLENFSLEKRAKRLVELYRKLLA
ncbi:MAG TPA: glycosyltransferase family 4 protein [Terriglobales bacterium]|nr:glycosyltransferase family 4 protein [Terriglobales bacterium]